MTYDTPERLDAGLEKLIATVQSEPALVAKNYAEAELARHATRTVWERPNDAYGERGIIEELQVLEGRYVVDITADMPGFAADGGDEVHTVTRYDSTPAEHVAYVHCIFGGCWQDGTRWLALFDVREVV